MGMTFTKHLKNLLVALAMSLVSVGVFGQVTIAQDEFEATASTPNINFTFVNGAYYSANSGTGDRPASSPFFTGGSRGRGRNNGSSTLTSANINTAGYTGVQLSFRLASFSINRTNNGADGTDYVRIEISPDGGSNYYNTLEVYGNSDAYWAYSATGTASTAYDGNATAVTFAPAGGGSRTTDGYSTVNVTSLPASASLRVRITMLNNSTREQWLIDDVKVTGTLVVCSGTPDAGVGTASPAFLTCSGTSVLSITGYSTGSGLSIQWQEFNGSTWVNAVGGSGATTASYTTPTLSADKTYRARMTCSNGGLSDISNDITVTIDDASAGTASVPSTSICTNTSTTLTLSDYTAVGTTIQWESSTDNATWGSVSGGSGSTTASYTTPNLTAAIYYRAKVTCTASGTTVYSNTLAMSIVSAGSAASLPFAENFETNCGAWTFANGSNAWSIGTSANNGGTRGMYVGAGTTAGNYNNTTTVSHAYRDIAFPAGQDCFQLKFDWRAATTDADDRLNVFIVGTGTTPTSGTNLATGQVGTNYTNGGTSFATVTIALPSGLGGTTQRLVFSWRNDASNPRAGAIALDNVGITVTTPSIPGAATGMAPTGNYTACTAPTLTWSAPANTNCNTATSYDVYFDEDLDGTPDLVSANQTGTSYTPDITYAIASTYRWYVVPRNSAGAAATPGNSSFTTPLLSAPNNSNTAPLTDGFESCIDAWTIINGTQTNKWFIGTNVKRSGTSSLYVGTATGNNNYTTTASSVVHVYRDIAFPADQCYNLSFYYKGQGEGSYDYMRVFLVQTSTTPTAGTQLSSGQIGATEYNLTGAYSQANIVLPSSIAGTTQRLVFSWRNDGSAGTTPAISIDDFAITASPFTAPSAAAGISSPANGITGLCTTPTLTWTAPASTGCNAVTGYDVYLNTTGTFVTPISSNQAGLTYTPGALALGTYYWKVVPRNNAGAYAIASCPTWSFNIGNSITANDLPCNAITLPLVVNLGGDNSCATATGEATAPASWTGGNINSVWYKITVPASGRLKIRTTLGTLTDTQIQLFTGTCGGTLTSVADNDNSPSCGTSSYKNSEITANGLTAGSTVFVRVDGANNLLGAFNIMAIDGNNSFPTATGQACDASVPVCNTSMNIGNPGYQGIGFECDFSSAGCLTSGERGSVWYKIKMLAAGSLNFSIIPNDYSGIAGDETDYDFAIWRTVGAGAVACGAISPSGGAASIPLRCNYSYLGVTGLTASGNSPAEYPGYDAAYETEITAAANDEFIVVISNYTNSTSGFTIAFDDASPVEYPNSSNITSVIWTGSVDTDWFKPENWGGCSIPSATISAQISPAALNQPILTGKGTCKDLVINQNATLTITLGGDLDIHGNYTNNGTLTALSTQTIAFRGAATQNMNGNMINESSLPNLTINKTGGSVITNQDANIKANFTTSSAISAFNGNGKKISVAGNFLNHTGNSTFIPGTGGTLEFNGTSNQTYTNTNGTLELENVIVNNTGAAGITVTLANNMELSTSGSLTLTSGVVKTGATPTSYEVRVKNTASAAVSNGVTGSYVWGYLRRYVASTGSYAFPMGIAKNNLAVVNFTAATTIHNLRGRFLPSSSYPSPSVGIVTDGVICSPTFTNDGGKVNHGAWEISAFNNAFGSISGDGTYTITLTADGFTNGAQYATVAKNGALAGSRVGCSAPSGGAVTVARSGLTGFSEFDVVQAANGPLPVTLMSLNATPLKNSIAIYWVTAQEQNNNKFEIYRSEGKNGEPVKIGEVRGMGNSSQKQNYYFEDKKVENGVTYYYSLRQIDNNGVFTNTHKVKATLGILADAAAKIYPNPSNANATLDIVIPNEGRITILITDILGRVIQKSEQYLPNGNQSISLQTESLKNGAYWVSVIGDNIYENLKFTKVE